MANARTDSHPVTGTPGTPGTPGTLGIPATRASQARLRKEPLAVVLRRRSTAGAVERQERTAAVQLSLAALARGGAGALVDVPLDKLHANPFQRRFRTDRRRLEELAQSLATEGQLEPAIARRVMRDGRPALEIVAGTRRLAAAKICNATIRPFPTLKVDVRELTDEEAERFSLMENMQRENLTPLEEGYGYWQLHQRYSRLWSMRTIAEFVHKQQRSVQSRWRLILDPAIVEAVLRGQITRTAGLHILRLPAPERLDYLYAAITGRLPVEQIKAEVDRRLAPRRSNGEWSTQASGEPGDGGGKPTIQVRARWRRIRLVPAAGLPARDVRRAQLDAQRRQRQERIKDLKTALRVEQRELQSAERALVALPE